MLAGYHIINFTVVLRHSTQTYVTKERISKKTKQHAKKKKKCEENEKVAMIKIMR